MGLQSAREALAESVTHSSPSASSLDWAPELLVVLETATSEHDEVPATVLCAAVLSCDNTATEVMGVLGVDRMDVLARLREGEGGGAQTARARSGPRLVRCVQQAVERAELLATRVGRAPDEGDVAVSLLDDPDSPLARALAHLGVDRERLEEALADTRSAN
jgi:ATP-dependent Clp protease ATP-binding subunit ClpA